KRGESSWGSWTELQSQRGKEKLYDEWGGAFQRMQNVDFPEVGLQVRRDGETLKEPLLVTLGEDRTWPLAQRGLILAPDQHLHKAASLMEALGYGVNETWRFITSIYLGLSRVVT